MKLDDDVAQLVALVGDNMPTYDETTSASDLRLALDAMLAQFPSAQASFDGEVRDDHLGGVPVRSYEPSADTSDVIVHLHGGGWVVGHLDSADPTARQLAIDTGCRVVSVDYRLAPEHPYPAALDDTRAVIEEIRRAWSPRWLGVSGDSAGGGLAAAVSTEGGVDAQLLIYPAIDPRMSGASHSDFGAGYVLTAEAMRYYWDAYGDRSSVDPGYAPALNPDLHGLPPAVVATAGFDVLLDEGRDYAARLDQSGVEVTYLPFPELIHGWMDLAGLVPAAAAARTSAIAAFDRLRLSSL